MRQPVFFADQTTAPNLGQGTWYMGEDEAKAEQETAALRFGIEHGLSMIDTAEMYADGGAEKIVAQAIAHKPRETLFLVSKVYPHNAGRTHIFASCEASLQRMGTDTLDLYLLHWRGSVPLAETVACMEELVQRGKIRRWGVSNFDVADMEELFSVPNGGKCATNQVLYHLGSRGVEYDLIPWMSQRCLPLMAYCPLAQQGRLQRGLLDSRSVQAVAQAHGISPVQVLLCFVLQQPNVIAIPKAGSIQHVAENIACLDVELTPEELALLDGEWPAPKRKVPLDMN